MAEQRLPARKAKEAANRILLEDEFPTEIDTDDVAYATAEEEPCSSSLASNEQLPDSDADYSS